MRQAKSHQPQLLLLSSFFNDTATTEIYTLSLHDALPISDIETTLQALLTAGGELGEAAHAVGDRTSTRLNSSHEWTSYAVFCLKKQRDGGGILAPKMLARHLSPQPLRAPRRSARLLWTAPGPVCNAPSAKRLSSVFFLNARPPRTFTLFPYTTLFR